MDESDASTTRSVASASSRLPQAARTIALSSRRLGEKMPGVSTRTTCAVPAIITPRTRMRVVCTLRETMVIFAPVSAFTSVDLPALGAPITAATPKRV